MTDLPVVLQNSPVAPFYLRKTPYFLICAAIGLSPSLCLSLMLTQNPIFLLLMVPLLFVSTYFISVPMALFGRHLYRKAHPHTKGQGRLFSQTVEVQKAWMDISKLRGRRGLVLNFQIQAAYLVGKTLEVVVRFRGPDGFYVRGDLRNYRGPAGEALVRFSSKPLKNTVAVFERLWMFLPIRALNLPPGTTEVDLEAEVLVGAENIVHTEYDLPIRFRPMPEDFPHLLAAPEGASESGLELEEGDLSFVGATTSASEATHCGVCGDTLTGQVIVHCSLCEGGHHSECWDYLGGCSTYACEGRPAATD